MWNENISCHINQQKMSQPSEISGLQMWMWAPQTAIPQVLPIPTPITTTMAIAEKLGACKKQGERENGLPQIMRCIWKERIQWSQRLASSHIQNAKFLNLIPDLWCLDCLLLLLQTWDSLIFPPASLEQFSKSYWDAVFQAWGPKHSYQIK